MATPINFHNESVDELLVEQLRNAFKSELDNNPDLYDQRDWDERIRVNDWYVKRYLLATYEREGHARLKGRDDVLVAKSLDHMKSVYRWRKEVGINDINLDTIPLENFSSGSIHLYKPDKCGYLTLYTRSDCMYIWPKNLDQRAWLWLGETIDRECVSRKTMAAIVNDFRGFRVSALDMNGLKFRLSAAEKFPCLFSYQWFVGMPTILNWVIKLFKSLLGPELSRDIRIGRKVDDLLETIDEANLPEYCLPKEKGDDDRKEQAKRPEFAVRPSGSPPLREMASSQGISAKELDAFEKFYGPIVEKLQAAEIEGTREAYVKHFLAT